LAEIPATLGKIVKDRAPVSVETGSERVSIEVILASGGACCSTACKNNCSLSFGAAAIMTTPSLVLVTVPEISKREAKL
jgi:hypothetical protein